MQNRIFYFYNLRLKLFWNEKQLPLMTRTRWDTLYVYLTIIYWQRFNVYTIYWKNLREIELTFVIIIKSQIDCPLVKINITIWTIVVSIENHSSHGDKPPFDFIIIGHDFYRNVFCCICIHIYLQVLVRVWYKNEIEVFTMRCYIEIIESIVHLLEYEFINNWTHENLFFFKF